MAQCWPRNGNRVAASLVRGRCPLDWQRRQHTRCKLEARYSGHWPVHGQHGSFRGVAQVHYVLNRGDVGAELGRWSLQGRLDWREWDGEFVVRADDTAATHLLSSLAGEAIKALRNGPLYVDEIAARIFGDTAPRSAATAALIATFAETHSATRRLLAALAELEALGLARVDLA